MGWFVKSWSSKETLDTCVFCDQPVRADRPAAHFTKAGKDRTVHPGCIPRCAEYGKEEVIVSSGLSFRPELKPGTKVERLSPCWLLSSDEERICAYHRWLKTAKPGDKWY